MLPARVYIEVIPHEQQRYATVGDWVTSEDNKVLEIYVSKTKDARYEWLIAVHELVESLCALYAGVTVEEVDAFDFQWERDTDAGLHQPDEEPGDDPECPVHRYHVLATIIERMVAFVLRVDWRKYEAELNTLWNSTRNGGTPNE